MVQVQCFSWLSIAAVRCGSVRCDAVRCGAVRCGAVRFGAGAVRARARVGHVVLGLEPKTPQYAACRCSHPATAAVEDADDV